MRALPCLLALFVAAPALAQSNSTNTFTIIGTNSTDLSQAMTICRPHLHSTGICALEPVHDPDRQCSHMPEHGWEACLTIEKRWWQSEDSRHDRERLAQERRDLSFVNRVAGKP